VCISIAQARSRAKCKPLGRGIFPLIVAENCSWEMSMCISIPQARSCEPLGRGIEKLLRGDVHVYFDCAGSRKCAPQGCPGLGLRYFQQKFF
jgi:hypothetical protein